MQDELLLCKLTMAFIKLTRFSEDDILRFNCKQ